MAINQKFDPEEINRLNEAWEKLTPNEKAFWSNAGRDFKEHFAKYYLNVRDADYTLRQPTSAK